MIIHSIIPYEKIFEKSDIQQPRLKPISGGYAEVVDVCGKQYISRIYSTDPTVYLNSKYEPGSIYTDGSESGQS